MNTVYTHWTERLHERTVPEMVFRGGRGGPDTTLVQTSLRGGTTSHWGEKKAYGVSSKLIFCGERKSTKSTHVSLSKRATAHTHTHTHTHTKTHTHTRVHMQAHTH